MKKISKRVLKVLSKVVTSIMSILVAFMLLMVISKVVMKQEVARIAGISSFVISSGSMRGNVDEWSKDYSNHINPGDIVISYQTDNLQVGDRITFFVSEKDIVTHRIVAIDEKGSFVTRGDANNIADKDFVDKDNVIGKVIFTIPQIGYLSVKIKSFLFVLSNNPMLDLGLVLILSGVIASSLLIKSNKIKRA